MRIIFFYLINSLAGFKVFKKFFKSIKVKKTLAELKII
ncbi:MAG: hypothetical protein RL769_4 [Pseudomonadota bacterium]|jgi:hypothetical protein